MPLVKPTTTGRGKYFTMVPMPVTPNSTRRSPAIIVHMNKPSIPCLAMIPATTTTNAPVGPPICVFEPPRAEIRKPVTMAQYRPACGETPDAMANAIASGSATSPTVTPAIRSERNLWRLLSRSTRMEFWGEKLWGGVMRVSLPSRKSVDGFYKERPRHNQRKRRGVGMKAVVDQPLRNVHGAHAVFLLKRVAEHHFVHRGQGIRKFVRAFQMLTNVIRVQHRVFRGLPHSRAVGEDVGQRANQHAEIPRERLHPADRIRPHRLKH